MRRYLFVVSRNQPELCAHLAREFSEEEGVEVVLDRRQRDRRAQRAAELAAERRRQSERRLHPPITQTLESLNFALVRGE